MKREQIQIPLTERDINILRFINDMGFCEMPHIDKKFGLKKTTNYRVINKLIEYELVQHKRIIFGRHGIFYLTKKGSSYTDLPPIKNISLGIYYHHVALIDVHLKLLELYPEASWLSERKLKQENMSTGLGNLKHTSDGILSFSDEKKIAIEVELTMKSKRRLNQIVKFYAANLAINEVWYYCKKSIHSPLISQIGTLPFIKIRLLDELLNK